MGRQAHSRFFSGLAGPDLVLCGAARPAPSFFVGLPGPHPAYFPRGGKVGKGPPKPMVLESFVSSDWAETCLHPAAEFQVLRASDLWWVSGLTSADALLMGQSHLFFHRKNCGKTEEPGRISHHISYGSNDNHQGPRSGRSEGPGGGTDASGRRRRRMYYR